MDPENELQTSPDTQTLSGQDFCSYCHTPLNPAYYFCQRCSLPYKDTVTILSPEMQRPVTVAENIRNKAPHVQNVFWAYFSVIIIISIVNYFLFKNKELQFQLFTLDAAIALLTLTLTILFWKEIVIQFTNPGIFQWQFFTALAALVILLFANYFYHLLFYKLLDKENVEESLALFKLNKMYLLIFVCIFPAIAEEIAFRGLVQNWLLKAVSPGTAILMASGLFTMLHFSVISFPYLFLFSLLLGWVHWKTRSLYPVMILHFLHNFTVTQFFNYQL